MFNYIKYLYYTACCFYLEAKILKLKKENNKPLYKTTNLKILNNVDKVTAKKILFKLE